MLETSSRSLVSATVVFGGVTVLAGLSCQHRTALDCCRAPLQAHGTKTNPYYLNNIINPVFVPLHELHRRSFIFMDDNAL